MTEKNETTVVNKRHISVAAAGSHEKMFSPFICVARGVIFAHRAGRLRHYLKRHEFVFASVAVSGARRKGRCGKLTKSHPADGRFATSGGARGIRDEPRPPGEIKTTRSVKNMTAQVMDGRGSATRSGIMFAHVFSWCFWINRLLWLRLKWRNDLYITWDTIFFFNNMLVYTLAYSGRCINSITNICEVASLRFYSP